MEYDIYVALCVDFAFVFSGFFSIATNLIQFLIGVEATPFVNMGIGAAVAVAFLLIRKRVRKINKDSTWEDML